MTVEIDDGINKLQFKTAPVAKRLSQEWILQNKAGYFMVFTQGSNLKRDSPDVDENTRPFSRQRTERIELHLGRKDQF